MAVSAHRSLQCRQRACKGCDRPELPVNAKSAAVRGRSENAKSDKVEPDLLRESRRLPDVTTAEIKLAGACESPEMVTYTRAALAPAMAGRHYGSPNVDDC